MNVSRSKSCIAAATLVVAAIVAPVTDSGAAARSSVSRADSGQSGAAAGPVRGVIGFTHATFIAPAPATKAPSGPARGEVDQVQDYLSRKEFDKALELASKMVRANPDDPVGYNLQGGAYAGKKDYANARKSFDKALSLRPDDIPVLMNLAQLDLLQKDVPGARKRYQAVLEKDARNVLALLALAQLEASSGNDVQSLALLDKAKSAAPEVLGPRLYLGSHYLRTRKFAKAIAEMTEALRTHPDNPEVLDLLGRAQLADGQKSQAVSTYRKLVSVNPKSPAAYLQLGLAQFSVDDASGAAESMKKAVQLKPDYEEAIRALAGFEIRAGRPAEALKLARDLQKQAPKSPAGLAIEGDVYAAQDRYVDAAQAYEKSFAVQPTNVVAARLHAAYTKAGNAKAADATMQRWMKDHPEDIAAWEYMALENLKAGKNKLAIEQYQLVLAKDPNNAIALNNLAILYHGEKDPRALDTAEQAYKLLPDSPVTGDTLGWILVEQGTTRRGLELLQAAAAKNPESTEVKYHLAAALAKSGAKEQARRVLEPLLASEQKFPEREAAQLLLKQL